jgi:hypothetical protein
VKLDEIFNTDLKIDTNNWQHNGRFLLTSFTYSGNTYVIQIEKKQLDSNIANGAEVSFHVEHADSEQGFGTSNQHKTSSVRVYGAILNAIIPQISQFDAITFSAQHRHSDSDEQYNAKLAIYSSLAAHTKSTYRMYQKDNPNSHDWLMSKIQPSDTSWLTQEQVAADNAKGLKEWAEQNNIVFPELRSNT